MTVEDNYFKWVLIGTYWYRFFSSVVDVQEIKRLESELGRRYQDLTLEASIAALRRMPIVLPASQGHYPDAGFSIFFIFISYYR